MDQPVLMNLPNSLSGSSVQRERSRPERSLFGDLVLSGTGIAEIGELIDSKNSSRIPVDSNRFAHLKKQSTAKRSIELAPRRSTELAPRSAHHTQVCIRRYDGKLGKFSIFLEKE